MWLDRRDGLTHEAARQGEAKHPAEPDHRAAAEEIARWLTSILPRLNRIGLWLVRRAIEHLERLERRTRA
jgi:hypothetical protein